MALNLYSPAEAADYYGQSAATVKRHCVSGRLPATKLKNGHWLIDEADLIAYAHTMGWAPRQSIEDDPWVWVPIVRKGIRFHRRVDSFAVTVCGRSTWSKASSVIKRSVALHYGMDECQLCLGGDPE